MAVTSLPTPFNGILPSSSSGSSIKKTYQSSLQAMLWL
ncbi:hypothetical protein PDIG_86030 [Penicillium digitatum PHI26]|uniref:Uncharacterized protein n=2 Tax=Penicillium digitatum TaxID=36651 RepID=K9F789_PEND2|nr:hypothetical protein PDIP_47040 [Penicillium digitatum Pd1]EKV04939.1 hypothetical protein PDIG_86030 [Penicillium digitatum PHI26]EKV13751.1 hypothetical protein PDIP_47040 [Penicillium digitatum Pd1]